MIYLSLRAQEKVRILTKYCSQHSVMNHIFHRVKEKLSGLTTGYSVEEAQAIVSQLKNIEESLRAGEKEKAELIKSLTVLRHDIISAEATHAIEANIEKSSEKHSTASQTDFCGEVPASCCCYDAVFCLFLCCVLSCNGLTMLIFFCSVFSFTFLGLSFISPL